METITTKQMKRHFSKIGGIYCVLMILFVGTQALIGYILPAAVPGIFNSVDLYMIIMMGAAYLACLPVVVFLVQKPAYRGFQKKTMTKGQLAAALLMTCGIMYFSNLAGIVVTEIIGLVKGDPVQNVIVDIVEEQSVWTSILIMVILAPVFEELLYRKILIDRTKRYGEATAILLSALLFALFHGNLNQFIYAFTLGMFFGFIYVKTNNVRYTILLHGFCNFMGSVPAAVIAGHLNEIAVYGLYVILTFAMAIAGLVLLIKNRRRFVCSPGEIQIPKGKGFSTTILNAGMLVYCIFWLVMTVRQLLS